MWQPLETLDDFNRVIVRLEQKLLAVFRGTEPLVAFSRSDLVSEFFDWIDRNPYQAVLMARIKSGHAMTPRHAINVTLLARAWAVTCHKLGDKLADFSVAALLHDTGHWRPDELVYVFGPFTHDEARGMREHPLLEAESDFEELSDDIRLWIGQHHEQPDGKGYPNGIRDPHILSQVMRIADCFDGLTTSRRFRLTYSWSEAMTLMKRWAGYKFNAGLFKSFLGFLGQYPVGTYVRFQGGEAGIIVPPTDQSTAALVLTNPDGDALAEPRYLECELDAITGEAPYWQELQLPETWQGLRPDLMGLPRYYQ